MPDWNTRLVVILNDEDDTPITPIDSFSPSFSLNTETLHSIEQTHIGVVYAPQAVTFSMSVRAIGEAVGKLTALALRGERFKVALQFHEGEHNDWSFDSIVLSDCIITSATPSPATISGAPAATFSGISLAAAVTPAGQQEETIP